MVGFSSQKELSEGGSGQASQKKAIKIMILPDPRDLAISMATISYEKLLRQTQEEIKNKRNLGNCLLCMPKAQEFGADRKVQKTGS